jgi:enoyl-CoA hydratase
MTSRSLLSVQDEGAIRILTLQRPEVHNAMSQELMGEVSRALEEAEAADQRALIVTGAGERSFCSGGDLREFGELRTREATVAMSLRMQGLSRALRRSPLVTIAAMNGDAYGGGLEFALAFDVRVAARHVRLGFLQVTLGITPAWRGVSRLRELVGRSTAMLLLLTGERFDAQAAQRYGIVDVVADGSALDGARALAQKITAHPKIAVRTIKAMVDAPAGDDDETLAAEASRFCDAWLSDEHWAALEVAMSAKKTKG